MKSAFLNCRNLHVDSHLKYSSNYLEIYVYKLKFTLTHNHTFNKFSIRIAIITKKKNKPQNPSIPTQSISYFSKKSSKMCCALTFRSVVCWGRMRLPLPRKQPKRSLVFVGAPFRYCVRSGLALLRSNPTDWARNSCWSSTYREIPFTAFTHQGQPRQVFKAKGGRHTTIGQTTTMASIPNRHIRRTEWRARSFRLGSLHANSIIFATRSS